MRTFSTRSLVACVAMAAVLAPVAGCKSLTTGNEGKLAFSYFTDDFIRDFNKPIAVGARLEIRVQEAGSFRNVTLMSAGFDDSSVLRVESTSADKIIVVGVGSGNALLEVEARMANGDIVTDSVNLTSRVPDVVDLGHTCSTEATAHYLVDNEVFVPFELKRSNNQPVIGYGYYPFTPSDASALAVDQAWRGQQFAHFTTGSTPGAVTLTSDLDAEMITLDLVAAAAIDGAGFWLGTNPLPTFVDGIKGSYIVVPHVAGKPVCQANTPITVQGATPDICTVEHPSAASITPGDGVPEGENGWVVVTGKQVGVCQFDVTHTAGAGGAGVTTRLSVDIVAVETP